MGWRFVHLMSVGHASCYAANRLQSLGADAHHPLDAQEDIAMLEAGNKKSIERELKMLGKPVRLF